MGFLGLNGIAAGGIGQGMNDLAGNILKQRALREETARRVQQAEIQKAQIQELLAQAAERRATAGERERKTQEETAMRNELSSLYAPQSAQQMAFAPGVIEGGGDSGLPATLTDQGVGMMNGQPSLEQYLGVLGKYDPKTAATMQVSLANTDERVASQNKIAEIRVKSTLEQLQLKQDQANKLFEITQDNKFKAAADKAASDMALLMERMQGMKDIAGMKAGANKAPSGYRATQDGGLEPIPGGPADTKKQAQFASETASVDSMTSEMDRLAREAKAIHDHPGLGRITGIMGAIPNIPGSAASDVEARLNTLKSQTAFSVLQQMRNNSKTGGALGQVSDKEGQLLQDNLAALDKAQSEKAYKESLQRIIDYTEEAKGRIRKGYDSKWGERAAQSAPDQTPSGPMTALPPAASAKGKTIRRSDGIRLKSDGTKWNIVR